MQNLSREPVAVRTALVAFVAALVNLLVLLKVIELDPDAEAAIVTSVDLAAGLAIILLVRPKVTPVADPRLTETQLPGLTVTTEAGASLPYTVVSEDRVPGPDHRLGDETP